MQDPIKLTMWYWNDLRLKNLKIRYENYLETENSSNLKHIWSMKWSHEFSSRPQAYTETEILWPIKKLSKVD